MSKIELDVGVANDLKLGFCRNDFSLEEVRRLQEDYLLRLVRGVLRGTHEVKPVDHDMSVSKRNLHVVVIDLLPELSEEQIEAWMQNLDVLRENLNDALRSPKGLHVRCYMSFTDIPPDDEP